MRKLYLTILALFIFVSNSSLANASSCALWAKSATSGVDDSGFYSVATDPHGNIYAVGYIRNGSGKRRIDTAYVEDRSVVLVKYDRLGSILWEKSTANSTNTSDFISTSIAVDSNGNIYVAGYTEDNNAFNAIIVKYDSSGNELWMKNIKERSSFKSIAIDLNGNIYAVGRIYGLGSYSLGNGITVAGDSGAAIVKYDSSGNAQWAKSTSSASWTMSEFYSVAIDPNGNINTVGYLYGSGPCSFGNGTTVTGTYSSGYNPIIVKYDSFGNALWAKSTSSAAGESEFTSLTIDQNGNIYAVGSIDGDDSYNFGNGVTVAGAYSGTYSHNSVIVKYDKTGNALWARSTTSAANHSWYDSVAIDPNGNIYTVGRLNGSGSFSFGNGVTVAGAYPSGYNPIILKYDSFGNALWAKSTTSASNTCCFRSIAIDPNGSIYAVGHMSGLGSYSFGNGVTIVGGGYYNYKPVIVKYGDPSQKLLQLEM